MKNTLKNVFHSPRFLVGFIIFMIILLTVLIYPYFVHRDPLQGLGKGFLEPGTYVSVYDTNNADTYRVELPEAADSFLPPQEINDAARPRQRAAVKTRCNLFILPPRLYTKRF